MHAYSQLSYFTSANNFYTKYHFIVSYPGGGGYSHVKAYGDVPPKWVTFSAQILRHGSHFAQKKSLEEGPISQKS